MPSASRTQADEAEVRQLLSATTNALQSGRLEEAARGSRRLLDLAPDVAQAQFLASHVEMRSGRPDRAAARAVEACRLNPGHPPWQLHEAICLDFAGDKALAAERAERLAAHRPLEPKLAGPLVQLLYGLGRFEAAHALCVEAVGRDPGSIPWQVNLASLEIALGNLDAARQALRTVLERSPEHAEAWLMWSSLGGDGDPAPAIDRLQRVVEADRDQPADRAKRRYALGALLERDERYRESFEAVSDGARIWRGQFDYDVADDVDFFSAIEATFDASMLDSVGPGHGDDRPIFVVGLPRTGTTLVERILSSHTRVDTAGELPDFSRHLGTRIEALASPAMTRKADMVPLARQIDYAELGRAYSRSSRYAGGSLPHFVDKFPQNDIHIGPIRLALPNARIVLVQRHPMDACYSMYKQLFTDIYQFSYDLDELADYYIAHARLMRHWLRLFPDSIMTVRYEDLVEDLEGQVRRLLDFCALPWEAGCVNFHQNRRPSTTASAGQVRRPIYRGSMGKWRHFREQLSVLEQKLSDAGCLDGWGPAD